MTCHSILRSKSILDTSKLFWTEPNSSKCEIQWWKVVFGLLKLNVNKKIMVLEKTWKGAVQWDKILFVKNWCRRTCWIFLFAIVAFIFGFSEKVCIERFKISSKVNYIVTMKQERNTSVPWPRANNEVLKWLVWIRKGKGKWRHSNWKQEEIPIRKRKMHSNQKKEYFPIKIYSALCQCIYAKKFKVKTNKTRPICPSTRSLTAIN